MRIDQRIPRKARPSPGRAYLAGRQLLNPAERLAKARLYQFPGAKKGTQYPGKLVTDDFTYSTPVITIGAGARSSAIVTIDQEADFQILQRAVTILNSGTGRGNRNTAAPITVQMIDVASERVLSSVIMVSDYAGTAQTPFSLGQRKWLAAMQSVRFDFVNLSATDGYIIQLSLIGRKLFL